MRERPADIRDSDVAAALAGQWALTVRDLSYLPVGFGGYHLARGRPGGLAGFPAGRCGLTDTACELGLRQFTAAPYRTRW